MKQRELFFMLSAIILLSCQKGNTTATEYTISRGELLDKIKGGWAGQVIGCTYGGPTEFVWNGTMIGYDKIPAYWKQGLDKVEHLNFAHTDMSLNKVYEPPHG